MTLFDSFLIIHILAGSTALLSASLAAFSKVTKFNHRWHILSERSFYWAMWVIFLTALAMSLMKVNLPLFVTAIFSFYLAFSGQRLAKNRLQTPHWLWSRKVRRGRSHILLESRN